MNPKQRMMIYFEFLVNRKCSSIGGTMILKNKPTLVLLFDRMIYILHH